MGKILPILTPTLAHDLDVAYTHCLVLERGRPSISPAWEPSRSTQIKPVVLKSRKLRIERVVNGSSLFLNIPTATSAPPLDPLELWKILADSSPARACTYNMTCSDSYDAAES